MGKVEIPFSSSKFDQQRLSEAGGSIVFSKRGLPKFRFENRKQYEKYRELNMKRRVARV